MYTHRSRGFTLIELLVVIAIIGILSAVVLASLNTARVKGNNAAIQSNLSTVQTQAEVYYGDHNNTYNNGGTAATVCSAATSMFMTDNNIKKAIAQAKNANGNRDLACFATDLVYAVSSLQAGSTTKYWCVDSTGLTGETSGPATATGCPVS